MNRFFLQHMNGIFLYVFEYILFVLNYDFCTGSSSVLLNVFNNHHRWCRCCLWVMKSTSKNYVNLILISSSKVKHTCDINNNEIIQLKLISLRVLCTLHYNLWIFDDYQWKIKMKKMNGNSTCMKTRGIELGM